MAHCISGLLASSEAMDEISRLLKLRVITRLGQGLAFMPLGDEELDQILPPPLTGQVEGFTYLCKQLENVLKKISLNRLIAYIETDYFGGSGTQGAVTYENGLCCYGPETDISGPINAILKLFEVKVPAGVVDEFDAIGLGNKRRNES